MPFDPDGLFRYERRAQVLVSLLKMLPTDEARRLADAWDLHDQELEDWLDRRPIPPIPPSIGTDTPVAIVPDQTGAAGAATTVSASDHRHGVLADPPVALAFNAGSTEGNAATFARSNHVHGLTSDTPIAVPQVAAPGVADTLARSDHGHPFTEAPQPAGIARSSVDQTFTSGIEATVVYGSVSQAGVAWDAAANCWVALVAGAYDVFARSKWNEVAGDNGTLSLHLRKGFAGTGAAFDVLLDDDHTLAGGNTAASHLPTNHVGWQVNLDIGDRLYCTAITYLTSGAAGTRVMAAQTFNSATFMLHRVGPRSGTGALPAPTIGTATAGAGQATANWAAVAGASGYVVTTYKASDSSILGVNGAAAALTYVKTGLTAGVGVFFRVTALYPAGNGASPLSAASNTVTPT